MDGDSAASLEVLRNWITEVVSEKDFETHFLPILTQRVKRLDEKNITFFLKQLSPPPDEIIQIAPNTCVSPLFNLLLLFLRTPFPRYKLLDLVNFLPAEQTNQIIPLLMKTMSHEDKRRIITQLPDCNSTFVIIADFLLNTKTFLYSFKRLFTVIDKMSSETRSYICKMLRFSVIKGIAQNFVIEMVASVFSSEFPVSSIEVVFTILCDDFMTTASCCTRSLIEFLLQNAKVFHQKLPTSLLKFLIMTKAQCYLSETQIWNYVLTSPSLLFQYLELIPIQRQVNSWYNIIMSVTMLQQNNHSTFIQIVVFYHFLVAVCQRPLLMQDNLLTKIFLWFSPNIEIMRYHFGFTELSSSFLCIFLEYCRLFDDFSYRFLSHHEPLAFFKSFIRDKANFKMLTDCLLWTLEPVSNFPFEIIGEIDKDKVLRAQQITGFTFSNYIATDFASQLLMFGIKYKIVETPDFLSFIEKIQEIFKNGKHCHMKILEILEPQILTGLLDYIENKAIHDFVLFYLTYSCSFQPFYQYFSKVCNNISSTIDFLSNFAHNSPIVSDFTHLVDEKLVNINPIGKTITMWVRLCAKSTRYFTITTTEHVYTLWGKESETVLIRDEDVASIVQSSLTIEGWMFITFSMTRQVMTFSNNLSFCQYSNEYIDPISLVLNTDYDLQSFYAFSPIINEHQIRQIFALGPNNSEGITKDFNFLRPSFIEYGRFVSSLYIPWLNLYCDSEPCDPFKNLVFTLKLPERGSVHLHSFLTALDMHGGFNLVIHLIAEVILNNRGLILVRDLHIRTMKFLRALVDRFPQAHQYFVEKDIYPLIGQLLRKSALEKDALFAAAIYEENKKWLLTNGYIIKYWMFATSSFQGEFDKLISSISKQMQKADGFTKYNRHLMMKIECFTNIVASLSTVNHSSDFMRTLIDFALRLVTNETANASILYVFQYLMVKHLSYTIGDSLQNEISSCSSLVSFIQKTGDSSVALLDLLYQLMEKYPSTHVQLELMIPAIDTLDGMAQSVLLDLLLHHLPKKFIYILGVVVEELIPTTEMNGAMFNSCFTATSHAKDFKYISIPLLYMVSHNASEDCISAITISVISSFKRFNSFEPVYYEQVLQMIFSANVDLIIPSNEEEIVNSTPFTDFVAHFILRSIQLNETSMYENFFIALLANKMLPVYRASSYALYFVSSIIENGLKMKMDKKIENFIGFVLTYSKYVINSINLVPGDRTAIVANILHIFISQMMKICQVLNNSKLTQYLLQVIIAISSMSTVTASLIDEIANNRFMRKQSGFNEVLGRLKNPTAYSPLKSVMPPMVRKLEEFKRKFEFRDEQNSIGLLEIICNAIQYQVLAHTAISSHFVPETLSLVWEEIFNSLYSPVSPIFRGLPIKYKLHGYTTRPAVRRILFPINPAVDPIYLKHWKVKYGTKKPQIRLTMKDVIHHTQSNHLHENILFSGDGVHLHDADLIRGQLLVTQNSIKFISRKTNKIIDFHFSGIVSIYLIPFNHRASGFIIIDNFANYYHFGFSTTTLRDVFVDIIQQYVQVVQQPDPSKMQRKWIKGQISNFDYLLYLNFLSGRTWSDFTKFPIFPWLTTDFQSELVKLTRDLSFPFFAQSEGQKKNCEKYLDMVKYHYHTYISNIGTPIYFLVRLEPYLNGEIDFMNGELDLPERTFQSFKTTASLMTNDSCKTITELVPELFFLPEFISNVNDAGFQERIKNVELPSWASSPIQFIRRMRKLLESNEVSEKLNEWIDLIWGVRRQGDLAIERFNIFQSFIFEFDQSEYKNDKLILKAITDQIHNCGQAPMQLFNEFHPKRKVLPSATNVSIKRDKGTLFRRRRSSFHQINLHKPEVRQRYDSHYGALHETQRISSTTNFDNDLSIKFTMKDQHISVIVHVLPFVSFWTNEDCFIKKLVGHPFEASSLFMSESISIVATGHMDGYISIFTIAPFMFIREIKCELEVPVSLIRVSKSSGNIFAFQEHEDKTRLSLFNPNGFLIKAIELNDKIVDCAITSFPAETSPNVAFLLTTQAKIVCVKDYSLKLLDKVNEEVHEAVSLEIEDNKRLHVALSSNEIQEYIICVY